MGGIDIIYYTGIFLLAQKQKPQSAVFAFMSGQRDLHPCRNLGRVSCCYYTMPAFASLELGFGVATPDRAQAGFGSPKRTFGVAEPAVRFAKATFAMIPLLLSENWDLNPD